MNNKTKAPFLLMLILCVYNIVQAQTFTTVYAIQSTELRNDAPATYTTISFVVDRDTQVIRELYMYQGFDIDTRHDGMEFILESDTIQADSGVVYLVSQQIQNGFKAVWYLNKKRYACIRPQTQQLPSYKFKP